jgi:hypothetical protein
MIAKTILHGWLLFLAIAFILIGFLIVKERGFRNALMEPRTFEAPIEEAAVQASEPTVGETSEEPVAAENPAPETTAEGVDKTPTAQPEAESSAVQQPVETSGEASVSADPTLGSEPPISTAPAPVNLCYLLESQPSNASRSFDEATKLYSYTLTQPQITVPFPAKVAKVYESLHSGFTLQLAAVDGSRALLLGGFTADIQQLPLNQTLPCGTPLGPLAGNTLHVQLRDTRDQEWWEGEVIEHEELFR